MNPFGRFHIEEYLQVIGLSGYRKIRHVLLMNMQLNYTVNLYYNFLDCISLIIEKVCFFSWCHKSTICVCHGPYNADIWEHKVLTKWQLVNYSELKQSFGDL